MKSKRSRFLTVNLKTIIIFAVSIMLTSLSLWAVAAVSTKASDDGGETGLTVVLDAGHGGFDGGVESPNGTKESDINLLISGKVAALLRNAGVRVVETRTDSGGLYGSAITDRKSKDMAKRKQIIEQACPNAVISIHANSFPQSKQRGAQVFYRKSLEEGERLAKTIQTSLSRNIEYCDRTSLSADYYILNCTDYPSALVECGFLSNAEDEKLLLSPDYQSTLAYYIYTGIMYFLYLV